MRASSAFMAAGSPVPVESGTATVAVQVHIRLALEE
jgi:hypothetical protein